MNDWSIDLETLDNKPTSAILSIGMVQFDRDTGQLGAKHYVEIDLDSAIAHGTVSASTLAWWMRQNEKAKRVFAEHDKRLPLYEALRDTAALIRSKGAGARVWGNGSNFDISILEHAFCRAGNGLALPWAHWNIRDMRTTLDDANLLLEGIPRVGVHHNALDDAIFQGTVISLARRRICKALGFELPPWAGIDGVTEMGVAVAPAEQEDDEL